VLDRLVLRATERRSPGPGEVEIAVEAAGLNFLDVLLALGVMPNDLPGKANGPLLLGGECGGRVVAVGEGVTGLAVGQAVVALAGGAFASHVTTSARLVLPRASGLSAIEAASLPVAYLTAWYALDRIARLGPGERVLIHAATGGVGQAAVQWAQHIGAEVYATAGSPEKRAYLESLGVKYVSDSRSDRFVADVRAWTGGEGVDVVLNSLSGEFLEKSFALLRSYGRFVELGKRDYYANNQLGLQPFLRNLSFSLVDLRGMTVERPSRVRALFEELLGLVASGAFRPPPIEVLSIGQATEAFRKMAQAQHVGKVVLTLESPEAGIRVAAESAAEIRADGTYLITGGLGGLGLSVAGWMAGRGAGHLVLVGRSGAASEEQRSAVASLEERGTRVTVCKADVSDRRALEGVLSAIPRELPLRGVVHAAGVLDDGMLKEQSGERFRAVMGPKAMGALHLHALTREMPLDFFVLYASGAGLLGSPGQGNYAAANTFLDALAHRRRAQGLPALSIDWGAFSEVGLAAAQENRGARLASQGMRSLTPQEGLSVLERLLAGDRTQVGVLPLNLRQWVGFNQVAASSRMLSRLVAEQRGGAGRPAGDRDLLARLAVAEPAARAAMLLDVLSAQVSQVLRIADGKLDVEAPLTSLGMDSLMGLELRNRIEAVLGITMSATLLWTYPTVAALSRHLLGHPVLAGDEEAARPPDTAQGTPAAPDVTPVDKEDLFALLDAELALAETGVTE
jgi:NADPH:quinone reductase-like Zn-dependent oxidoreductase/acyl carrier protein